MGLKWIIVGIRIETRIGKEEGLNCSKLEVIFYTDECHGTMHSGPDVRYQMDLEYLQNCAVLSRKNRTKR